jgi:hypothetical protein
MTEREQARDRLLVAIGYALASESDDTALADALNKASEALDVASARQRDRDANGVRRAMGRGEYQQDHICPECGRPNSEHGCGEGMTGCGCELVEACARPESVGVCEIRKAVIDKQKD